MVTHTWHTSKYKVHKLHQRYMIRLEKRMFTSLCVCVLTVAVPRAQQDGCHVPELLAQHDGRQVWGVHRRTFPQAGRAQDVGMHGVSLDFVPAREPRQAEPREWGDSSGASFQCCFPSTETIRLIRDEGPRMATSTFTQLLSLSVALRPQRPYGVLPECCFTSTETVRCIAWVLLYVHRDRTVYCLSVALRPQRPYGVLPECCFMSTETVRCIAWVLLYVHRDRTVYCGWGTQEVTSTFTQLLGSVLESSFPPLLSYLPPSPCVFADAAIGS